MQALCQSVIFGTGLRLGRIIVEAVSNACFTIPVDTPTWARFLGGTLFLARNVKIPGQARGIFNQRTANDSI
jgi:hypothetical protein